MAKKNKKKPSGGLNTSYLTKMGAHNLIANRSMSFSSISVLTACLLLIGISIMILMNIQSLVKDVENQNVVVAFLKDDLDDASVAKAGSDLKAITDVTNVEFVSKEEAFKEQQEEFGIEEGLLDGVIDNTLPDSYRVTVGNLKEYYKTLEQIKAVDNVTDIRESQELVKQITTLQTSITAICIMVVIVLGFVSMFIISNTIRITMVSRKIDIQVMKSVGATNTFICWPFMIEGIIIGLIAGISALILTLFVQRIEGDAMASLLEMFGSQPVEIKQYLPKLTIAYLFSGILISAFGSLVSIRKYLKKEGSEANDI